MKILWKYYNSISKLYFSFVSLNLAIRSLFFFPFLLIFLHHTRIPLSPPSHFFSLLSSFHFIPEPPSSFLSPSLFLYFFFSFSTSFQTEKEVERERTDGLNGSAPPRLHFALCAARLHFALCVAPPSTPPPPSLIFLPT